MTVLDMAFFRISSSGLLYKFKNKIGSKALSPNFCTMWLKSFGQIYAVSKPDWEFTQSILMYFLITILKTAIKENSITFYEKCFTELVGFRQ